MGDLYNTYSQNGLFDKIENFNIQHDMKSKEEKVDDLDIHPSFGIPRKEVEKLM